MYTTGENVLESDEGYNSKKSENIASLELYESIWITKPLAVVRGSSQCLRLPRISPLHRNSKTLHLSWDNIFVDPPVEMNTRLGKREVPKKLAAFFFTLENSYRVVLSWPSTFLWSVQISFYSSGVLQCRMCSCSKWHSHLQARRGYKRSRDGPVAHLFARQVDDASLRSIYFKGLTILLTGEWTQSQVTERSLEDFRGQRRVEPWRICIHEGKFGRHKSWQSLRGLQRRFGGKEVLVIFLVKCISSTVEI